MILNEAGNDGGEQALDSCSRALRHSRLRAMALAEMCCVRLGLARREGRMTSLRRVGQIGAVAVVALLLISVGVGLVATAHPPTQVCACMCTCRLNAVRQHMHRQACRGRDYDIHWLTSSSCIQGRKTLNVRVCKQCAASNFNAMYSEVRCSWSVQALPDLVG